MSDFLTGIDENSVLDMDLIFASVLEEQKKRDTKTVPDLEVEDEDIPEFKPDR